MLDKYNFKSIFFFFFNNFVLYKRSLGLDYKNEISRLRYIDNILFNLKLKNKKITKDTFIELTKRNMSFRINDFNGIFIKIYIFYFYLNSFWNP